MMRNQVEHCNRGRGDILCERITASSGAERTLLGSFRRWWLRRRRFARVPLGMGKERLGKRVEPGLAGDLCLGAEALRRAGLKTGKQGRSGTGPDRRR